MVNPGPEWLTNSSTLPPLALWSQSFAVAESIVSWVVLFLVATLATWYSAYSSGSSTYTIYCLELQIRIDRKVEQLKSKHSDDILESTSSKCSTLDIVVALVAVALISGLLILIYFFKWLAVPIFLVIFAMSSLSLFTLCRPIINQLPGDKQIHSVPRFLRCCCGVSSCELREILLIPFFLAIGWTWYIFRHNTWVILFLHNFLGFSLVFHVVKGVRITRFQTVVYPCILLLIYDVFMVFVTPYFTKGASVMESVARGTDSDDMPLVFKVPTLFHSTENICSKRRVAGLLGFGDVIIPSILTSFMVLVGKVLKRPRLYMITTFISYPASLVICILSLYLMGIAQPALLYIVPLMLLTIVGTASVVGDLSILWHADLMQHPKSVRLLAIQQMKDQGIDDENGIENDQHDRTNAITENHDPTTQGLVANEVNESPPNDLL